MTPRPFGKFPQPTVRSGQGAPEAEPTRDLPAHLTVREQIVVDHLAHGDRQPVTQPHPTASPDEFEAAVKKNVSAALFDPRSQAALLEALRAPDLKERRMWWQLALDLITGANKSGGQANAVVINFKQQVPQPEREDGPLDITPRH